MKLAVVGMMVIASMAAAPAMADESGSRTIYKCESSEGLVFSDHPCGPSAETYRPDLSSVSVIDTVAAAETPSTPRRVVRPAARPDSHAASRAEVCARLDQSLHKIAATLRAGYGVKQGERLKQRKRELEAHRRAQKC